MMELKQMCIEDYEDARSLWEATEGMGMHEIDDSPVRMEAFLGRNPTTCFTARDNSDRLLVGVILCGHDGRRATIYHAAVREDYRGSGIGRKLVEAVLTALRAEEIRKVRCLVFSSNETGNRFWERMGFSKRVDVAYWDRTI